MIYHILFNNNLDMTSDSAQQIQLKIVQDFQVLGNWQQRYAYLIDMGKALMKHGKHLRLDKYRLHGCQASVWLKSSYDNQTVVFTGTSDSIIVAGMMALLFKVYSGQKASDIPAISPTFLTDTGLLDNLSSQRATGLQLMLEQMQEIAMRLEHKQRESR